MGQKDLLSMCNGWGIIEQVHVVCSTVANLTGCRPCHSAGVWLQ